MVFYCSLSVLFFLQGTVYAVRGSKDALFIRTEVVNISSDEHTLVLAFHRVRLSENTLLTARTGHEFC